MKHYLKLARPHHWVKNIIVLFPLFFSGQLLQSHRLLDGLWAFLAFSLLASAIYCVNDIRDREKDRAHPTKCRRPVAAGNVSVRSAAVYCAVLLILAVGCGVLSAGRNLLAWLWLALYFLLNLGYSMGLKNLPLIDVTILAAGFLLRLLYGGAAAQIELSNWLCLTVTAMSFFLGLGKRRGELVSGGKARKVLAYYSEQFLGYNMYMCLALAVMFYALWTVDDLTVARAGGEGMIWTVPLVILCCMRYSQDIEGNSDGDPVEVLLKDKLLLGLGLILAIVILTIIYLI